MTPPPDVRCAGCGKVYSTQFIRCWACRTLTADSVSHWERQAEIEARGRGCIVIPLLAAAGWGIIALLVMLF